MKKYILILLLTVAGYGQTYQNPTFGTVTTKTNTESATANRILAQETDGKINWLQPVNIPIPLTPTNYLPTATTLGGHLTGIDNKLGTIVATTAGITTRVWFTADVTVVSATNYYATNATSKGTLASAIQSVINNDNEKKYFTQDLIGNAALAPALFPAGIYAGNLSASTTPNSAQQRWTIEIYKCDNAGAPIASGITGAPVGSLGVTVVTILDSGLLTLADGSVTNVQVSGNVASPLSLATGERIRYHVSAEKVGTAATNITQSVYYGTSYNSYIDVPVPLNTTAVQNLSGVTGGTTTDALNTLLAADGQNVKITGNQTKTGTLGLTGLILNANASAPATTDGIFYKLTQPTTAGWYWSTSYTPVLSRYNGLLEYVRNKPATFRKKLMVVGSSVAYGQGATSNNGWANRLGTDITARGWTYTNRAIPGNSTQMVIDRFYTDVTPENPDVLIIALSLINEGIFFSDKEVVYNTFKSNLQKLVKMCSQHDIIPVIANAYPNNDYLATDYRYIQQINKELDSWGVPTINMLGALDDLSGKFVAGSFVDASHPNDTGHQEMYKSVPPSMFDALVNWDTKRLNPEKGAITIGSDVTNEKPLEAIFDGAPSNYTVSFWLKVNDAAASGRVLAGFGTGIARFSNSIGIGLRYVNSSGVSVDFGVFPEVTKNWYHVAVTYNSITQKSRAYMNGVFMGEVSDNVTLSRMAIGGRSDTGQAALNSLNTDFKDVAIYRGRLTDIQIKELYSGNILKSSLEIFSPLSDKEITKDFRMLNFAPTLSYLKVNSTAFTPRDLAPLYTTDNQDFTGLKSTTNSGSTSVNGFVLNSSGSAGTQVMTVNVSNAARGVLYTNTSPTGAAIVVANNSTGIGTYTQNNTGTAHFTDNNGSGTAYQINSATGSLGDLMQFRKNAVLTTWIDNNGLLLTPPPTITTAPATSAGSYDILTRSISTGVMEKIPSANVLLTTTDQSWTGVKSSTNSSGTRNGGLTLNNTSSAGGASAMVITESGGGNGVGINATATVSGGTAIKATASSGAIGVSSTTSGATGSAGAFSTTGAANGIDVFASSTGPAAQIQSSSSGPNIKATVTSTGDNLLLNTGASASGFAIRSQNNSVDTFTVDKTGVVTSNILVLKSYTVATLPTPTGTAYATVTDALAPTYLTTVVGGGAVVCPVFFDGVSWKAH